MEMARDALLTMFAHFIREGQPVNLPGNHRGRKIRWVELPVMAGVKISLYDAFQKSGMTKAELARRLGIPKTNVDRLFNLHHHSRMELIEAAFTALGKRLEVEVRDAA